MNDKRKLELYVGCWVIVGAFHTLILTTAYHFPVWLSAIDSLIFNGLYALLGIGVWYMVRYTDLEYRRWTRLLLHHVSALTFILIVWILIGQWGVHFWAEDQPDYIAFNNRSVIFRLATGTLFYLIVIGYFYLGRNINLLREKIESEKHIAGLLKESELQALRAQINPHFLFNTLNTIHSLIISNPQKAGDVVIRLSDSMRYSLNASHRKQVSLSEELEQIHRYLDIEYIRFGSRLHTNFEVNSACLDAQVPFMLLQPFVENAVKHGIYGETGEISVSFSCRSVDQLLLVRISNPYDPAFRSPKANGTGIRNARERLFYQFNRNDLLHVEADQAEFNVLIYIPQLENRTSSD